MDETKKTNKFTKFILDSEETDVLSAVRKAQAKHFERGRKEAIALMNEHISTLLEAQQLLGVMKTIVPDNGLAQREVTKVIAKLDDLLLQAKSFTRNR